MAHGRGVERMNVMIQEQVVCLGERPRLLSGVFGGKWFGLDTNGRGGGNLGFKNPSSEESAGRYQEENQRSKKAHYVCTEAGYTSLSDYRGKNTVEDW
jgi:hypothetical protein